ncbi:hypothetical protein [Pasteurella multocida]|uniref:hypothetical protein n=1 Tax=Pasteurella multocida TaxID=747 RepID=UPI00355B35B1
MYDTSELWIKETDTLIDNEIDYFAKTGGYYDKVIGNPPYGAWQDHEKKYIEKEILRSLCQRNIHFISIALSFCFKT